MATNKSYPSQTHLTIDMASKYRTGFAEILCKPTDPTVTMRRSIVLSRAMFCSLFAQWVDKEIAIVEDRTLCTLYIKKSDYLDFVLL